MAGASSLTLTLTLTHTSRAESRPKATAVETAVTAVMVLAAMAATVAMVAMVTFLCRQTYSGVARHLGRKLYFSLYVGDVADFPLVFIAFLEYTSFLL